MGACFACSKSEVLQVRGAARRVLVPLVDRIGSSILQRAATFHRYRRSAYRLRVTLRLGSGSAGQPRPHRPDSTAPRPVTASRRSDYRTGRKFIFYEK